PLSNLRLLIRGQPCYVFPKNQRMDVVRPLVRVNGFQIAHVTEDRVLQRNPTRTHQIPGEPCRLQRYPNVVPLGHRCLSEVQSTFIFKSSQAPCKELPFRDFRQHVRQLLLDELELCDRLVELYSSFCVVNSTVVTRHRRSNGAPRNSVSSLIQTHERRLQSAGFRQ